MIRLRRILAMGAIGFACLSMWAVQVQAVAAENAPLPPPPDIEGGPSVADETAAAETLPPAAPDTRGQQETPELEQPDLPPPVQNGENIEPDITIIRRGKDTIQEYSVNGKRYMVKITPAVGPSYYLVDTDGDGTMDVRRSGLESGIRVPQWVLFSW